MDYIVGIWFLFLCKETLTKSKQKHNIGYILHTILVLSLQSVEMQFVGGGQ